jgi:hypothetical protein
MNGDPTRFTGRLMPAGPLPEVLPSRPYGDLSVDSSMPLQNLLHAGPRHNRVLVSQR